MMKLTQLCQMIFGLVDLPLGSKPNKQGFKKKCNSDGTLQTFKARLVAKGFTQKKCLDYFDIYAPAARIMSIRIPFALASIHKLHVYQMDVKSILLKMEI